MPDFNASDRKSIRKAEKAAALVALQDREAVAAIMSTIPGRAWMWRKLSEANIFTSGFSADALRDAFTAGQRDFGLRLLADIMLHSPDAYLQMTKEANNVRHDSNNGNPTPERSGSEIADGGDSGSDGEPAEGSITDFDHYGPEADGPEARH